MLRKIIGVVFGVVAFNSYAIDCPKAKIENIQPEIGHILYKQVGYDWRKLGSADSDAVKAMYSALLAAQMSGKSVMVRYPDGFDCNAYELETAAYVVRTFSD